MSGGNNLPHLAPHQRGAVPTAVSAAQNGDNPYLQHLEPKQRGAAPSSSKSVAGSDKEPLFGFMPRKVTAKQATKAMVCLTVLYN